MRTLLVEACALTGLLAACIGQGAYTRDLEARSRENMARLHGATEYDRAMQLYLSGKLELALRSAEQSIALMPENAASRLLLGRILIELGDAQAGLLALEQGLALDPLEPDFHYYRGVLFEQLGRLDQALAEYQAAIGLGPSAPHYRLAAVEVLVELQRLDEGRALLESDQDLFVSHAGFRQELGYIQMLQGDTQGAVRSFRESVVLSPGDPVLVEDLCRAQLAEGMYAHAEASLRSLAETEADLRPELRRLHARCLVHLHRPVEARAILLALTREEGGAHDVESWSMLVDVALMLHDDRLLRSTADHLLTSAPDRHEGFLALATWRWRTGDLEGALQSVAEALERDEGNATSARLQQLLERELAGVEKSSG
jgi:tetratricopeptide (TPR) repeat protein